MVGACQQNSGIFLVRGGEAGLGPDEIPVGPRLGWQRANHRGWAGSGTSRDRGGGSQINSKENAL